MTEKSITKFENLSNELLFDIFEYLYGEELFAVFHDLNHRINNILNDSRLLVHITFSRMLNIQSIFDPNKIQFINVKLPHWNSTTFAVDLQKTSLMIRASRLSLNMVYIPDLIVGLWYIKCRMPNLVHVSINAYHSSDSVNNNIAFIIEGLLNLSLIRTLSLHLIDFLIGIGCIRLSRLERLPFLEHLSIIGYNFSLLSVIDLMKNSPRLYSLQMKIQKNAECPDYSVFQQLRKATLQLIGFNNDNLQKFFSSMARIVSLRLDNEALISTARLCIPHTARVSQTSSGYFNHWQK